MSFRNTTISVDVEAGRYILVGGGRKKLQMVGTFTVIDYKIGCCYANRSPVEVRKVEKRKK